MTIGSDEVRSLLGRNLTYGMADALGKSIVSGGYDDKPLVTEAELSKLHGVSRSVTREAVKMLSAKGLVSARPRQGTVIEPASSWNLFDPDILRWLLDRKFSIDLLRHFNQLRGAIEPAAAALAATNADTIALALIRSGYERMKAADSGAGDTLDADIAFHLAILLASKNPFFAQFRDVVATALRTSIRITNRIHGRPADIAAHRAVMIAIESRKPDVAHKAMAKIISDAMRVVANDTASLETQSSCIGSGGC